MTWLRDMVPDAMSYVSVFRLEDNSLYVTDGDDSHHQLVTDGYFKAGAYTQANCENSAPCSSDNYGEVIVYDVGLNHSDAVPRYRS